MSVSHTKTHTLLLSAVFGLLVVLVTQVRPQFGAQTLLPGTVDYAVELSQFLPRITPSDATLPTVYFLKIRNKGTAQAPATKITLTFPARFTMLPVPSYQRCAQPVPNRETGISTVSCDVAAISAGGLQMLNLAFSRPASYQCVPTDVFTAKVAIPVGVTDSDPTNNQRSDALCRPLVCGDAICSANYERCDDGNATAGDGCSNSCTIETGWACTCDNTGRSTCTRLCGNGRTDLSEECDNGSICRGGSRTGQMCYSSSDCSTSNGRCTNGVCSGKPSLFCATDRDCVELSECVYNTQKDLTCSNQCKRTRPVCGDAFCSAQYERCDDGNTVNGDGCTASCTVERNWSCTCPSTGRSTCARCGDGICLNTLENYTNCPADCRPVCGDAICSANYERCDDGNAIVSDGCASCVVERGWTCTCNNTGKSICTKLCGNGKCDIGESNTSCPADCPLPAVCGDGIWNSSVEQCGEPGAPQCSAGQVCQNCKCVAACVDPDATDLDPSATRTDIYSATTCTSGYAQKDVCDSYEWRSVYLNEARCRNNSCEGSTVGCPNGCRNGACNKTRTFECGNGVIDTGETCDLAEKNGIVCTTRPGCQYCSARCQITTQN
ncbi:MAG: DUF4215 domain-containing protein [Candidatus Peregrinibacteria bacterium]